MAHMSQDITYGANGYWAVTIIEPMFDHQTGEQKGVSQRMITSADGYVEISGEPQGIVFKSRGRIDSHYHRGGVCWRSPNDGRARE